MKIVAIENGPYFVETAGKCTVAQEGTAPVELAESQVFLCRCGGSKNKPFCDGTHQEIGFEAPGAELEG